MRGINALGQLTTAEVSVISQWNEGMTSFVVPLSPQMYTVLFNAPLM